MLSVRNGLGHDAAMAAAAATAAGMWLLLQGSMLQQAPAPATSLSCNYPFSPSCDCDGRTYIIGLELATAAATTSSSTSNPRLPPPTHLNPSML
jgi:hypothetical protein